MKLKKKAGVMLAVSMLCAMVATGCNSNNTNDTNKSTATEATTNATVEEKEEATKEVATEAIKLLDKPAVIKEPSDVGDIRTGITVEGSNSRYTYISANKLKDYGYEYELRDDKVKEIFYVSMNYHIDDSVEYLYDEKYAFNLQEKVKVSIPYEENMYLVHSVDGVAYDVNAEYIDGKYVFETDKLGTFVFRTEPIGRATPEKTKDFELAQQTIVDEITGIEVSGMLPVGADIDSVMHIIDNSSFYDRWDFPYTVEKDYIALTDVMDYYIVDEYDKENPNIAKIINQKGWAQSEAYSGGKITARIELVKNYEVLDFETDLTVTLPFNYRRGLANGGITDEVKAIQYDYGTKEFVELELVSAEATPKGSFQFKTKTNGRFFIGGKEEIDELIKFYTQY